jgi:hypothetical protein
MTATTEITTPKDYISLGKAVKKFPGPPPHTSTLTRWSNKGVRGVKLKTKRVGNRLYTTEAAIDAFLAELNTSQNDQLAAEGC